MDEQGFSAEWLEANELGSYAASCADLMHSRKYHGYLVSFWRGQSYIWINKIEEEVQIDNNFYILTGSDYRGARFPALHLAKFSYKPYPCWEYKLGEFKIIRELVLVHNQNTLLVKYQLIGDVKKQVKLILRPMFSCRDRHSLQLPNELVGESFIVEDRGLRYQAYPGFPEVWFQSETMVNLVSKMVWYYDVKYQTELDRGYDGYEALYLPGELELELNSDKAIIISVGLVKQQKINYLWDSEIKYRTRGQAKEKTNWLTSLQEASKVFLTLEDEIIAGYPWFGVWTRDAMISLPGLTLFSGREKRALSILRKFASFETQGILPNYLGSNPSYNSVDAALWFIWACSWYYKVTLDSFGINSLLSSVEKIIEAHFVGTGLGVRLDETGLIYSSSVDNVTWMDAKVNNYVITPRSGYVVELNALWYHALTFLMQHSKKVILREKVQVVLDAFRKNFIRVFWNNEKKYLNDFVTYNQVDSSLRPNQLWAVALDLPISDAQKNEVVRQAKDKLFTPYGLRTLSPEDSKYCGYYAGDQNQRDLAYHNGTVWTWLLGVFTDAVLNIKGDLTFLEKVERFLKAHLELDYGLGGIAEVFDGDWPHRPNGSITQAWSVAEVLRIFKLTGYDRR